MRLVLAEDGDGIGAVQLRDGRLHRLEQVSVIQAVDQVADHLGVGLAVESVALALQRGAQFFVVFDDAVVDQRDAAGLAARVLAWTVAEVRMRVVNQRRAVRGPARVGNAGGAREMLLLDLLQQLGHPVGAARALQAVGMDCHAAGVIAPVFQPLQTLHQDGNDIASRDGADDATHRKPPVEAATLGAGWRNM